MKNGSNARPTFRGHAAAVVAYGHHHILARRHFGMLGGIGVIELCIGSLDRQLTVRSCIASRELTERFNERIFQLVRVDHGLPQATGQYRLHVDAATDGMANQIGHAAHDLINVNVLRLQRLLPGKRQQAHYERDSPVGPGASGFEVMHGTDHVLQPPCSFAPAQYYQ